jgi:hypothetical protein
MIQSRQKSTRVWKTDEKCVSQVSKDLLKACLSEWHVLRHQDESGVFTKVCRPRLGASSCCSLFCTLTSLPVLNAIRRRCKMFLSARVSLRVRLTFVQFQTVMWTSSARCLCSSWVKDIAFYPIPLEGLTPEHAFPKLGGLHKLQWCFLKSDNTKTLEFWHGPF